MPLMAVKIANQTAQGTKKEEEEEEEELEEERGNTRKITNRSELMMNWLPFKRLRLMV